jgi:hypothetical protein
MSAPRHDGCVVAPDFFGGSPSTLVCCNFCMPGSITRFKRGLRSVTGSSHDPLGGAHVHVVAQGCAD